MATALPAPRPLHGVALLLVAVCCFATMDTTVRARVGMAIIAACGAATAWLNVRSAQRAHRVIPASAADTVLD